MTKKRKVKVIAVQSSQKDKPIVFTGNIKNEYIREELNEVQRKTKEFQQKIKQEIDKIEANTKNPLAKLQASINETNEKIRKAFKKEVDAVSQLTGKPIEIKSTNPFAFSRTQRKLENTGIMSLLGKQRSIKMFRPQHSLPRLRPVGHKREAVTGTGLNSFMIRHKLENPVDFAKAYTKTKGKDYAVKGFINIRYVCEQMNVTPQEAMLYICEGMRKTDSRWKEHRINKEYWRGSQSVINLVDYFEEKKLQEKKKNTNAYTVKRLYYSQYVDDLFKTYGCPKGSYSEFTKWFKKMKYHVEMYKKSKKK